jgi:hypothetical protein
MEFNLKSIIPYVIDAIYTFLFQFHEPLNHWNYYQDIEKISGVTLNFIEIILWISKDYYDFYGFL